MFVSRLCLICSCLFPLGVLAQFQTLNPIRFVSVYAHTSLQSEQRLTDSAGSFQQACFSAGIMLPIVHKVWESSSSALDVQLHPAVNYTHLRSTGSERILRNPQLTASTFFSFRSSHRIALNIRGQYNEDEFTATYPKLVLNGTAYYSKGLGQSLRLHGGAGYSFIWGQKQWYPIIGLDIRAGAKSRITVLYPLVAAYQFTPGERLRLTAFAKPTGFMSFVENRLNIPDTARQTLVFSMQSISAGIELSWLILPSLNLVLSPAYTPAQTTKLQNREATTTFSTHNLSDAFVFYTRLVWRPQRNRKHQPYNFINDNDLVIPF